jgi:hypothetical protein
MPRHDFYMCGPQMMSRCTGCNSTNVLIEVEFLAGKYTKIRLTDSV